MFALKNFFLLYLLIFSLALKARTYCRDSINGKDQGSGYCYWSLFDNGDSIYIAEHSFHFDAGSELRTFFLKARTEKGGYYSYGAICNEDYFFPEAYNECTSWWINPYYKGIKVREGATGATLEGDAKYFVPYCFTMKNIYLYRIIGLGAGKSFELVDIIPWERPIESAKFFGKYLVLIDVEYINIFELKGQKLKKVAEGYFPHPIEEYHFYYHDEYNDIKLYDTMDQYFLEYPYLYLLLEHNLEGFGPIATFKIEGDKIKLIDKGIELPCDKCNKEKLGYRKSLKNSKIDGKTYFLFWDYEDNKFFKISEKRVPSFLFDEYLFGIPGPWKDEYLYGNCCSHEPPFYTPIFKFTEEGVERTNFYSFGFE